MPARKTKRKNAKKSTSKKNTKKRKARAKSPKLLSTKTIVLIAIALFVINLVFLSIRLHDEKLSVNEYDFMVEIDESSFFMESECGMSIFKKCYSENFRLPMYFFVQKIFIEILNIIPFSVFFLSLLCSSGIVALIFLFLYRFTDLPSSLMGTALYMFTFINFNYSREVEEYVFVAFFLLLTLYLYMLWMSASLKKGKILYDYRFYIFLGAFIVLSFSQNLFLYVFILFMLMHAFFCFRCKFTSSLWRSFVYILLAAIPAMILIVINTVKYIGIDYVATSFGERIHALSINIPLFLDYFFVVNFSKIWEVMSWSVLQVPYIILLLVSVVYAFILFFKKARKKHNEDEVNNKYPLLFMGLIFITALLMLSSAPNKIYTFFIVYPAFFLSLGFGIYAIMQLARKLNIFTCVFVVFCIIIAVLSIAHMWVIFSSSYDYEFSPSMEFFVEDFLSQHSFEGVSFYSNANHFASEIFHNTDSTLILINVKRGFEYPDMCKREYNSEKSYEQIDTGKVLLVDWNMDHLRPMNATVVSLVKENYDLVYEYDEQRWFVASYYER